MGVEILDYKGISLNNIVYEEPKKMKSGSFISEMKYLTESGEKKPIIIQTPRLLSCQGVSKMDTRCHIEFDFDKDHWPFYEFITDLDDHNIVIVEKYSDTWFKQKFPIDVVEEFYRSPVKLGRGKNPPKLKLRIPMTDGLLGCDIFDNNKQKIDYTTIDNDSKIISVLHLIGLRFLKQQVICEWVPLQLKIYNNPSSKNREYLIDDTLLSDNEDPEESLISTIEEPHFINTDLELKSDIVNESSAPEELLVVEEELLVAPEEEVVVPAEELLVAPAEELLVAPEELVVEEELLVVEEEELVVPAEELVDNDNELKLLSKIELLENEIEKKNQLIENLRQLLFN
jgi:hypothetical protein